MKIFFATLALVGVSFTSGTSLRQAIAQETIVAQERPCSTGLYRCHRRFTQLEQLLGQAYYDAHNGVEGASKRVERLREVIAEVTKYIEEIKSSNVQECPRELRKEIRERCSRAALDV
mmetsp:Transcript_30277/g.48189  ORF Transcript_30277/g.48189 Transcript_30277/m.48189 type:complete len:118 (-) Transcript_30277:80-433(-)